MQRRELQIKWKVTRDAEVNEPTAPPYGAVIRGPTDLVRYLSPWAGETQECFVLLALNAHMKIIGHREISRGTATSCAVPMVDVARAAILSGAAAVIVAHNHPSGDIRPSEADRAITRQLQRMLSMLEIPLLDHVIIGLADDATVRHYSFRDGGRLTQD